MVAALTSSQFLTSRSFCVPSVTWCDGKIINYFLINVCFVSVSMSVCHNVFMLPSMTPV